MARSGDSELVQLRVSRLRKSKKWVILGRIANIWWMGPYDRKEDAVEDMQGVLRTIASNKAIFSRYEKHED